MAGNQLGKTIAGGAETAMHLTGLYPEWWTGLRFRGPIRAWFAGNSSTTTRDIPQRMLFGPPSALGSGFIPKNAIGHITKARGVPNLIDSAQVKHVSGGESYIASRSYDQDPDKWQGETLDWFWGDEEMRWAIWSELVPRLNAGRDGLGGCGILTATPLLGMSNVIKNFYPAPKAAIYHRTLMGINDVPEPPVGHYSVERREEIINSYEPWERKARAEGIPSLGSGPVFPVEEGEITIKPFEIPSHWFHVIGMDFGWDHPTAAVHMVIDRDSGTHYIVNAYRKAKQVIPLTAAAVKPWGPHPVAWPHDGYVHDRASGVQEASAYRKEGLKMLASHATHPAGGFDTEIGIKEMLQAMQTGKLLVFAHLGEWFEEFRTYHRKDGKIVKEGDDLMSAMRMAWMMRRAARQVNVTPVGLARKGRYDPMKRATSHRPEVLH